MDVQVESRVIVNSNEGTQLTLKHGRSPKEVETRLDRLIDEIRTRYQKDIIGQPKKNGASGDVLVVAHGHILRAFAMRWINKGLTEGITLLLDGTSITFPPPFIYPKERLKPSQLAALVH